MSPHPPTTSSAPGPDPYAVLNLPRTATDADIKARYKQLARQLHPDRNLHRPEAQAEFQKLKEAHDVLGDPERRAAFDRGGHSLVALHDAPKEIDPTRVSGAQKLLFGALAGVARAAGVSRRDQIRLGVNPDLIQNIERGIFPSPPTLLGPHGATCTLDQSGPKAAVAFRTLLTPREVDGGVVLAATSDHGDDVSILAFEPVSKANDQWRLVAEAASEPFQAPPPPGKTRGGAKVTVAALYGQLPGHETLVDIGCGAPIEELRERPEMALFGRLRQVVPRECVRLDPGEYLLVIVNRNFVRRAKVTLRVLKTAAGGAGGGGEGDRTSTHVNTNASLHTCLATISAVEASLVEKRAELIRLESQFVQAQKAFEASLLRAESEHLLLEELLGRREGAYVALFSAQGGAEGVDALAAPVPVNPHTTNLWAAFKRSLRAFGSGG